MNEKRSRGKYTLEFKQGAVRQVSRLPTHKASRVAELLPHRWVPPATATV